MNVKNNIKKVTAVLASTALVATTMVGAMAYDLSDYPAPFVEDGMAQGKIVVGANAATQDVLGAIDIAASLQESAATPVAAGGLTVTVEGGEEFEDIAIGDMYPVGASETLDDSDLEGFEDDETDVEGTDYDFVEEVVLSQDAFNIAASYQNNWDEDENYGSDLYLELADKGVTYQVRFDDDPVPVAALSGSVDDDFDVDFLGQRLTVQKFDANSITVQASSEYFMEEGDSIEVNGRDVTLVRVGEGSVLVDVDGQTLAVNNDGSEEEYDQAGDFKVEVESSFYIEGADDNSATLSLGSEITDTYDNEDAFDLFGGTDDDDEATWVWDIDANNTHLTSFGVKLNQKYEKLGVTDPEDRGALAVGEELDLGGRASISMVGLSEPEMSRFSDVDIGFDNDNKDNADELASVTTPGLGSQDFLEMTTEEDDFVIKTASDGTKTAEEVFIGYDGTDAHVFFDDGDDEYYAGILTTDVTSIELELDSERIAFTLDNDTNVSNGAGALDGDDFLNIDFNGVETLSLDLNQRSGGTGHGQFGTNANDADSGDLASNLTSASRISGSLDEDVKTKYGVVIQDPENQFDSDDFSMSVPHAQQQATVVVRSEGSVVSAGSSDGDAYAINPVPLGLGILDTDAPALGTAPMIIVGGPAANTVAAEFMGNPTSEELAATFTEGKALIRYNDDNQAMLVAGWGATETLGASQVVADYANFEDDFVGTELDVTVTDLSNIQVSSVQ